MSGTEHSADRERSAREEPDATASANPYTDSLNERLAETFAALESTMANMSKITDELSKTSHVARSRDRAVEATAGPQGQLLHLRFLDNKYRTMSPTELASSVMEAVTESRDAMSRQVMSAMAPFTQPLPGMPASAALDINWAELFGPGVLEDPETMTRKGNARLRDEINEDGEE
ncbi:YbaB/EbfC family nucleoid-associated protein [Streptomyces tendae]